MQIMSHDMIVWDSALENEPLPTKTLLSGDYYPPTLPVHGDHDSHGRIKGWSSL